jgi:hypothetical protein
MTETPWFERNLSFGKPLEMLPYYLERLDGTLVRLEQKVKGVDNKILSTRFDDKWSIKENIGHMAEVDEVANKRIDEMTSGVPLLSPAVFEPKDYNPWSIHKVLAFFREVRVKNLVKYRALSNEDLTKASMHPRLRVPMTPVDLAWFDAEHDDHHLVKISVILSKHNR